MGCWASADAQCGSMDEAAAEGNTQEPWKAWAGVDKLPAVVPSGVCMWPLGSQGGGWSGTSSG